MAAATDAAVSGGRAAQHRYVFVGGLHRSGTSLLFRMLRDHPEISGFRDTGVPEDEGQLLQDVYPPARKFGGPGKFGFDSASFLDETSPLATPENAERLFAQWARFWDTSATLLLEKSPPNIVRTRFLQELFPDSRFIMQLRHPVAVALATAKWSRTSVPSLIEHWILCHERFDADRGHLLHLYTLKYEELVREPGRRLSEIWKFLGLPPAPAGQEVQEAVNEKYFTRWRELTKDRPRLLRQIIDRFEPRVRRFGYSLEDLQHLAPYPPA